MLLGVWMHAAAAETPTRENTDEQCNTICSGEQLNNKRQNNISLLNKKHTQLMLILEKNSKFITIHAALEQQQSAWLHYVSVDCEAAGVLTQAGGSWPTNWAIDCENHELEKRLRIVDNAITCIQKNAAKDFFDVGACLQDMTVFKAEQGEL